MTSQAPPLRQSRDAFGGFANLNNRNMFQINTPIPYIFKLMKHYYADTRAYRIFKISRMGHNRLRIKAALTVFMIL